MLRGRVVLRLFYEMGGSFDLAGRQFDECYDKRQNDT